MTPRAVRINATWPLRVQRDGQLTSWGNVVNVSTTGILFACPERFEVGERVTLYLLIDRSRELKCRAQIVRVAGSDRRPAFAASFERFADDHHQLLGEALTAAYRAGLGEEWHRAAPADSKTPRNPVLTRR